MPADKAIIAVTTGDSGGIGPEISLKAVRDPAVRAACNPILVSDPGLLRRHAEACGIPANLHVVARPADGDWSGNWINVLGCAQPEAAVVPFGSTEAASGRATIAFLRRAIRAALAGEVDAVVAAPQNETAIARARTPFDGHPSFVARETGTDESGVYLMLCFGKTRIVHCTLHQSVRAAIAAITPERVLRVIQTTDSALRQIGVPRPRICVSGINPHAGEGGLFGSEDAEIIKPAVDLAVADGLRVAGPFGADTMFQHRDIDAFIVMLHDQGHIVAKLLAPNAIAAMTIGIPILFSSVAHGCAPDIAGRGIADPSAMLEAIIRLAKRPEPPLCSAQTAGKPR